MSDATYAKIRKIVAEELNVTEDDVTLNASFQDDLGADSLDIVEMIMALESEFGIEVSDEKAEALQTVADVMKFIEEAKGH